MNLEVLLRFLFSIALLFNAITVGLMVKKIEKLETRTRFLLNMFSIILEDILKKHREDKKEEKE